MKGAAMNPMQQVRTLLVWLRARLATGGEGGSITLETVIIAAVLSGAAITAAALIVNAITSHASQIK
jgi:hypothetical protein